MGYFTKKIEVLICFCSCSSLRTPRKFIFATTLIVNVYKLENKNEYTFTENRISNIIILSSSFLAKLHVPVDRPRFVPRASLTPHATPGDLSRRGGGVNTFFVGEPSGRARGTAPLTCRFGIKWTCNTPCLNRFHNVSSSTKPPWVAYLI